MLETVSVEDLANALLPGLPEPCWPGLADATVKERAREYARQSGLWEQIAAKLKATEPIPVLRYSDYRDYQRTGSRERYERLVSQRVEQTHLAALALWLDHPAANVDYLQDLLWAWCESAWNYPAHELSHIELVSSSIALLLAEYAWLFRERIELPVQQRVNKELDERMLSVVLDWRKSDWWNTTGNNWNSVCNGNLIQIAMYQVSEARQLAALIHPLVRRMDYAIQYFPQDGGCPEGAGYWEYGFGHFLDAALVLQHRTGGKINLADDEHIRRICRFPLAVQLQGSQRANFSDSSDGWVSAQMAMKINRLCGMSEIFSMVAPSPLGLLQMQDIRTLTLYQGQRPDAMMDGADYLLPQLGYAKVHAGPQVVLAAISGRNDVSHNHNDIGSFILMAGGKVLLTDPGAPVYSAKTFGPKRYEMFVCRSRGHSVPLINGCEQSAGSQYWGTIEAQGLNVDGNKMIRMDLSHAYPDPTLERLVREFHVQSTGEVHLVDAYRFNQVPRSLEEAFITFESVVVAMDGESVLIGEDSAALTLACTSPGRFAVEEISASAHEGRGTRPLRRITFTPQTLTVEMELMFSLSPRVTS